MELTGFGSSVKIINVDSLTALRSCGIEEVVRDTVLDDNSPAARWNLVPYDGNWFACRPASDEAEVLAEFLEAFHCILNRLDATIATCYLHVMRPC